MRFTIFTHVPHTQKDGCFYGYAPYIREMNLWLRYVLEVEIVAPVGRENFISNESYCHKNLTFTPLDSFNLLTFKGILKAFFYIPKISFEIVGAMKRSDHLHLRCPGNIGLISSFFQIFFPDKPKSVKYAGNWDPKAKQPWSYKLQKWILGNTFLTRNVTVLNYGIWPNQSKNIRPFFTATFSENEIEIIKKDITAPFKFLFVGNLVSGKQPRLALQIVEALNKRNIPAALHVYGNGELMPSLQEQAKIKTYIHLHGNQPLEILKKAYKDAHFLILASKSEGWPKVVAEAMWFGCIPIATAVSCVPWILGMGSRGILISDINNRDDSVERGERTMESQDVVDWTITRIIELISKEEKLKRMSMEAQEWSQQYTLERFEEEIKKLLAPAPEGEAKKRRSGESASINR